MNVHLDGPGQLADLHLALLLNGVYTTPRGMINLSTALGPADLADVGAAYERRSPWSAPASHFHDHEISLERAGRRGMGWPGSEARATPALRRPRTVAHAPSMNSA